MPNTDKTAVEIEWLLDVPVREDLYEYMPSGRRKVISKRIPISVDYEKMLEEGLIKVENCTNCWQVTEGKMHIDVMVCHILFYVFRKYQEEGKIPEHISYNV